MHVFFALLVMAFAPSAALPANTESAGSSGTESLGRELLDDLTPQSLLPTGDKADQRSETPRDPSRPMSRFEDLGEDVGHLAGPLSLARVRQGMQEAEALLATQNSATDTERLQSARAVQQRVVEQLDELIADLSKQCQSGHCPPGEQPAGPSEKSTAKAGKLGSAAGHGQRAARDSNARLDRAAAEPVEKGDLEAIVHDLWGHLPERAREQMLQSFTDEFLPKYELEIEQYYRRLSEDKTNGQ